MITKKKFKEINYIKTKNFFNKKISKTIYKKVLPYLLKNRIAHQTSWFGEPILQFPQDLFAIQEIIFKTKPDYIIEIGVAWSGSLLFYSSIFNSIGGKKIIGVDTYIPKSVSNRLSKFENLKKNIILIEGMSTDPKVISKIKKIIKSSKKIFIHLDSDHSHKNVLQELNIYSEILSKNNFIICGDTHVEYFKKNPHGLNKNYSKGNNPMTALESFLKTKEGSKFKKDRSFQNKYFLTLNPDGYLKKIK